MSLATDRRPHGTVAHRRHPPWAAGLAAAALIPRGGAPCRRMRAATVAVGCLGSVTSAQASAARLRASGQTAAGTRDVVELIQGGNHAAIRLVRHAGRVLAEVPAMCVNFINPDAIVLGDRCRRRATIS
jgi:hypothetical protein